MAIFFDQSNTKGRVGRCLPSNEYGLPGMRGVGGGGLKRFFFFIQYFSNILVHPLPLQPRHQGLFLRECEVRSEKALGRG